MDWKDYCEKCFAAVHDSTLEILIALADKAFGHFTTSLPYHVSSIIEELVQRRRIETSERIQWMLELESPPFTNNTHYFSAYREKYLTRYRAARLVSLLSTPTGPKSLISLAILAEKQPRVS